MSIPPLAQEVVAQLKAVPGVRGVALGGSHATGTARPDSDIDLCLAYDAAQGFDLVALNALCCELDDSGHAEATAPGGWGPWVDGGAWLTVRGVRVDFIYRELGRVGQSIEDALAGKVALYAQVGHPHGIHAHHYAAELASCVLLQDDSGRLAQLQAQVRTYPDALAKALQSHYGWQKGFWLDLAEKGMRRGDVHYAQGCAYQAVMALVQEICAVHKVWILNEKASVARAAAQASAPANFEARVNAALGALDVVTLRELCSG